MTADNAAVPALRFADVHLHYRDGRREHPVLIGASLQLMPGERVALVGESGSGKSTLLNVAAGIEPPDAGGVEILGRSLQSLNETGRTRLRREHVGLVYQFFNLVPHLTVLENVRLPLDLNGWARDEALERSRTLLARVGLVERGDDYPAQLSGGEQQRVAIARAIAHRPALILADEPTGSLDRGNGDAVLELLNEAAAEAGCALLMVTHSQRAAAQVSRTLRLVDGCIRDA
ncbi:MAG: ABC transporter ATP-binding protein [Gammaproteobacteria bacterium]|jgi:putative ABC transport system ATP-binding protein